MNKSILIGRLTKDPELKYSQNNKSYCRFTLAVNRPYKNTRGESEADFINCIAWNKTAENLNKFMRKGSQIAVEGSIQTGSYKNQDGKTVYTTNVLVERVEFLSSFERQQQNYQQNQQTNNSYQESNNPFERDEEKNPFDDMDYDLTNDDLPF